MSQGESFLAEKKPASPLDVNECVALVKKEYGKPFAAQVWDIIRLGLRGHRLNVDEYYYYRLYDDDKYSFAQKSQFLGIRAQRQIIAACDPPNFRGLAHDKLVFQAYLDGLGAPCAKPLAVLHPFRRLGKTPCFSDAQGLAGFLASEKPAPFFAKPVTGMWSLGTAAVDAISDDGKAVILAGGREVALGQFCEKLAAMNLGGYLLQERLTPHPDLAALCGPGVSTLRLVVMIWEDGPEIFQVIGKLVGGGNMADNFWRQGNLLADLDPHSGVIRRAFQGVGPFQEEMATHPGSGENLPGFAWPHWQAARELVLGLAASLPGMRLQAWDLAICESGPMAVELNVGGDFNLPQIASQKGLMTGRFQEFVAYCQAGK